MLLSWGGQRVDSVVQAVQMMHVDMLPLGRRQPFYHVLVDVRCRPGGQTTYVAQVGGSSRLLRLRLLSRHGATCGSCLWPLHHVASASRVFCIPGPLLSPRFDLVAGARRRM